MNNFLNQLFAGIGSNIIGDVQTAATDAFYTLAGELLVIIILLGAILIWGIALAK